MKKCVNIIFVLLFLNSCENSNRSVEKVSESLYVAKMDDSTEVFINFHDKKESNNIHSINHLTIRNTDTTFRYYSFYPSGIVSAKDFYSSKKEKTDFFRFKPNGTLDYRAERSKDFNRDGISVKYISDTIREGLAKKGQFYFIKRGDTIDLARPRDFSLDRLNADSFAYSISNDLKDFQQLSFNPNRLRLVFLSAQHDLDFQANYNLETNSTITDTVSLEKFEKGEKVYIIVNYFGDPIVDRREDWDEIHFIVDSIVI